MSAQDRLRQVLPSTGLRPTGPATLVPSWSNDAWRVTADGEDYLLRVCWRGDRERLAREAVLGRVLPGTVGYPRVIGSGRAGELTWLVAARLPGLALMSAWEHLSSSRREQACRDVVGRVRALHRWSAPVAVARDFAASARRPPQSAAELIGRAINPLPVHRMGPLVDHLVATYEADADLFRSAHELLLAEQELLEGLDDPRQGLVHADLHLHNVWTDGERVTALLDLEWARLAPAYVDLARIQDYRGYADLAAAAHEQLLEVFIRCYPELFEVDHLQRRLRAIRVAFMLRQLAIARPSSAPPTEATHPLLVLRRLLGSAAG